MNDEPRVERFPSGVAGLDAILHGGFIQGGIYLIQGSAGSGKTILGNQLCCHRASRGGKAIYVTLLSESIDRMLLNIGGMLFFDPNLIPQSLHYVSGMGAFEAEGLKGLLELIRRELRARRADMLVIDGLGAAEEPAAAGSSIGEFTHQLQAQNGLLGCTTFVLSRGTHVAHAERTIVDGLIELSAPSFGARRERRLELTLLRGSDHLRGKHSYEISERGLRVYPRLEALLGQPADLAATQGPALPSGIAGLDQLLRDEGLPAGSATLIDGPPGSGKSALALQFVSACSGSERGVYLSFTQGAARAAEHAQRIGCDLGTLIERGAVQWLWRPARERGLDALGHELLDVCAQAGVTRVVIDGLDTLQRSTIEADRMLPFTAALLDELRARGITTLVTVNSTSVASTLTDFGGDVAGPVARSPLASAFEVCIGLQQSAHNGRLRRSLALLKAPGLAEGVVGELSLGPDGIRLGPAGWSERSESEAPLQVAKPGSSKPPVRPRAVRRK